MKQAKSHQAVQHDLRRIVDCATTSSKQKEMARTLLTRFETPISICVMGPDKSLCELVRQGLEAFSSDQPVGLWKMDGVPSANPETFTGIDIAIWCSRTFCAEEERSWAHAPDTLKDRSVLICLSDEDTPTVQQPVQDHFDEVVSACVHSPTDTLGRLSDYLLQRVHAGLSADFDSAAFLIESCHLPDAGDPAQFAFGSTEDPQTDQAMLPKLEAMMERHAAELSTADIDENEIAAHVLSSCEALLQQMADVVEIMPLGGAQSPLLDDVQDIQDRLLLMAMDDGMGAATEAVSCLIQLRKELHLEQAA